jgi:hypothetical protein
MDGGWSDGDRAVELEDDGPPARHDPEAGGSADSDDERLRSERPPHWDRS